MINDSILSTNQPIMESKFGYFQQFDSQRGRLIETKMYETFGKENIKLVKEINGTMKFNLSPRLKISKVLENLEMIKGEVSSRHRDNEEGRDGQFSPLNQQRQYPGEDLSNSP